MNVNEYGQVTFDSREIIQKIYSQESQSIFGYMDDIDEISKWNENCSHFEMHPLDPRENITQDVLEYHSSKNYQWKMPVEFLQFDPIKHCIDKLIEKSINTPEYIDYMTDELKAWEKLMSPESVLNLFRFLHYLISTCESNNIITGVGRGSSVSSLILYLLGVHYVDPVKYKLNYNEFLR